MKILKVNQIEKNRLSEREMGQVQGGTIVECTCSCYYEGQPGGSSTMDNGVANMGILGGGHSKTGVWKIKCIGEQTVIYTETVG